MIVTVQELLKSENSEMIQIPLPGRSAPLDNDDREVLRSFVGLAFEVASQDCFPLQVHYLGGCTKRLGIFPLRNQIKLEGAASLKICAAKTYAADNHELVIFRDPLPDQHAE